MSFANTRSPTRSVITGPAKYQLPHRIVSGGSQFYMTQEQEEKFCKLYPVTENRTMMQLFGIGFSTLQRFRKELGLKKDLRIVLHKTAMRTKETCEENGWYDHLRETGMGQACREAASELRATGWHPLTHLKKMNPRRYASVIKKRRQARLDLEKEERWRISMGLPQKTKLHRPQVIFDEKQLSFRYNMKRRGYILGDMSEDRGERYVIYYDEDTQRSSVMERHAVQHKFTVTELTD